MLMSLNRATQRGFSIVIVTLLAVLLTTCTSESEVEQLSAEIAELRTELAAEQVAIADPIPTPEPEPNATPIAATPTPIAATPTPIAPTAPSPTITIDGAARSINPSNGCGGIINQEPHLITENDFTRDVIDCLVEMTKSTEPIHIIHGPSLNPEIVREVREAWQVGSRVLGAWGPLVVTLVQMNDPEIEVIAAQDCAKRRSLGSHVREGPNACEAEKTAFFNTFTQCCGAVHDPPEPLAPIRAQYMTFASIDQMFLEGDVAKVFLHEYMHVFQNGGLVHTHELRHPGGDGEDAIDKHGFGPVWIEEAAAEYFAQRFATENGFWDTPRLESAFEEALRAARHVRAEWGLSLRDVETRTGQRQVNEKCECGGMLYYETGIVATSWLVNRVGSVEMLRYYTLVAYKDWQDVFKDVFGLSLEEFYTQFDQWLDLPFEQQWESMVGSLSK